MPYSYPFPIDPQLTAISLAYKNPKYIASEVLPKAAVPSESFKYRVFAKELYLTLPETEMGRKGEANEVELSYSEITASTLDYGLADVVPVKDINLGKLQNYDPQQRAVEYLTALLDLSREARCAKVVFDPNSYASGNSKVLSGAEQFSHADSDPLKTIINSLEAPFFRPNLVVMGREVFNVLARHPKILRTVYPNADGNGIINASQLAAILSVDRVLVGEARLNSARKGKSNIVPAWGKHLALLYVDSSAGTQGVPTFGLTAEYGTRRATTSAEPKRGIDGSYRVQVAESLAELVVAPDLGYLLQNAIA